MHRKISDLRQREQDEILSETREDETDMLDDRKEPRLDLAPPGRDGDDIVLHPGESHRLGAVLPIDRKRHAVTCRGT